MEPDIKPNKLGSLISIKPHSLGAIAFTGSPGDSHILHGGTSCPKQAGRIGYMSLAEITEGRIKMVEEISVQ